MENINIKFIIIILLSRRTILNEGKNFLFVKCLNEVIKNLETISASSSMYVIDQFNNSRANDNLQYENFIATIMSQIGLYTSMILADKILDSWNPYQRIIPSNYLIIASDVEHLSNILFSLNTSHPNWYPNRKFVIFIQQEIENESASPIGIKIFSTLRTFNIYDYVVLIPEKQVQLGLVNIYSNFPFDQINLCNNSTNLTLINRCTAAGLTKKTPNLYPLRTMKKLTGCVLRVGSFHWPPYTYQEGSSEEKINFTNGYNVLALQMLAYKYKLTALEYVTPEEGTRWGMVLDNGTWTGALGMLQNNQADIVIGGALQTFLRFSTFDCSPTYNSILIKFYLPLPSKLPHWKNMINIFSLTFWITITIIYIITSICICLLAKLIGNTENNHFKSYTNCFLTLWRMVVGSSAYHTPSSETVRIVFLLWLVYNFHVTLVYTSSLLGFITTPSYYQPIKTIKELADTNLQLLLVKQFVQISNLMDEELKTIILRKFDPYADPYINHDTDIERMINKKDVAILDTADHFEIFAKERLTQIYALEDVIRLNPGMYLKKGSMYLQSLNDIQLTVLENGMFSKWGKDILESYKYKKYSHMNYDNEVFPLTLQELSGPFYILLFGLLFSFLIFVTECIIGGKTKNF